MQASKSYHSSSGAIAMLMLLPMRIEDDYFMTKNCAGRERYRGQKQDGKQPVGNYASFLNTR